jgi:hypothetical protein
VEADRFGVRVLMPGDQSVGWMAFVCAPEQSIKTVTIPVSFTRSLTPDGVLEIPVREANSAAMPAQDSAINGKAAADAMHGAQQSARDLGAPAKEPGQEGLMQEPTLPSGGAGSASPGH